ncbi:beta-barrel assembly-enhancing protease [Methylomagnum sp.]
MNFKKLVAVLLILSHTTLALGVGEPTAKPIELPDIGDPTGTLMTPQQEAALGEAFYRGLHGQADVSEDPEVLDYIQTIGDKLVGNSDNPAQRFMFFVVNEPVINAFAGPGGYIGVNSGLILLSDEESELASVLAHEISHVTQRHLYQTFQAANRLSIPVLLATVGALVLGGMAGSGGSRCIDANCRYANQSSNAGIGLATAVQAAANQYLINFTRDNEAEADRVGMQILSKSDFDPRAMPAFFERMQQSTRFAGNRMPEFLLTHPVTVSRISDTRGRAESFPYRQYPDSMAYLIIKAKLRAQTVNPQAALDYFKAVANQGTKVQQDVTAYGTALAMMRAGRREEAKPILQRLVMAYPNQSQFVNALAQAEADAKNYAKAIQIYDAALQRFPGNQALTLNYVRVLLVMGKGQPALRLLHDYSRYQKPTPDVYELMAQGYSQTGNEGESHRYLAEAYYAAGQTKTALLQLKLAKQAAGDNFYLNSVIDERASAWMAEERAKKSGKS